MAKVPGIMMAKFILQPQETIKFGHMILQMRLVKFYMEAKEH